MFRNSAIIFTILSFLTLTTSIFLPNTASVHPGDSASFVCLSRESDVDFQFRAVGSTDTVMIYNRLFGGVDSKYENFYKVNITSDEYTLTIMYASLAHAGTYICEGEILKEEAELTVLAAGPAECISNESTITEPVCGTEYRMECNVGFVGNLPPTVEFRKVSSKQYTRIPSESSQHNTDSNISQNRLVQRIFPYSSGVRFECNLESRYKKEDSVRSICTSDEIIVLCDDESSTEKKTNVLVIVLPVVGVVCAIVIPILICLYFYIRRTRIQPSDRKKQPIAIKPSIASILYSELPDQANDASTQYSIQRHPDRGSDASTQYSIQRLPDQGGYNASTQYFDLRQPKETMKTINEYMNQPPIGNEGTQRSDGKNHTCGNSTGEVESPLKHSLGSSSECPSEKDHQQLTKEGNEEVNNVSSG